MKNYLSEELLQKQWAEFIELKRVISDIFFKQKIPITMSDIGIGNARIAKHLSGKSEMCDIIES